MRKIIFLSILIFLLFVSSLLFSNTIIVDTTGAGDYTTIQEGIDAASDGDTVLVYPGTYYENINYIGKNITVASLYIITQADSFIYQTIIDGNQNGSVVTFESGEDTTAVLCGFTIQNGSGTSWGSYYLMGGGIYTKDSGSIIKDCIIKNNNAVVGGGIFLYNANAILENVTIYYNHSFAQGGGLHSYNSIIKFSCISRCNIYNNYASNGCDIDIYEGSEIDIIVDTFTVMEPDSYFISSHPENNFTLDILNAKIDPVNQDLYVSPDGDNTNTGLSENEPLQSISWALTKISSDSTHPNTIHLANGVYSPLLTNEMFPLNCRSYVSIIGQNEENTILNGENLSGIIFAYNDNHFYIENLTIQNGHTYMGGGIIIHTNSSPVLINVTFIDNFADMGTSIFCIDNCNPIFENVTINGNPSVLLDDEPISIYDNSNPVFINCIIEDNHINPEESGVGAISCVGHSNPILINTKIIKNDYYYTSAMALYNGSQDEEPILINCTICDNSDCSTGTINQLAHTNLTLINCILRNYAEDEIWFDYLGDPNIVTISYTNIEDSINAINTNNNGTINWLEGNIDADPMFVDTLNNNYQLLQGSPCIDAGNPDTTGLNLPPYDLAGNPRIYNGIIDMGAYECQGNGVVDPEDEFYKNLYLFQNKPNPFVTSTTITFISADYERIKDYKLSIYNAKGQLIKTYNGKQDNFWVKTDIIWDGTGEDGRKVANGAYFYKLSYGEKSVTRKMLLIR